MDVNEADQRHFRALMNDAEDGTLREHELPPGMSTRGGENRGASVTSPHAQRVMRAGLLRQAAAEADLDEMIDEKVEARMKTNDRPAPPSDATDKSVEVPVNAPVESHTMYGSQRTKAEFDRPLPKGASFGELIDVPEDQRGLSLGKTIRGMITGNWKGAEREERAMSGATAGAGGSLLPQVFSAEIVDLARVQTQVINAGASVVPLSNRTVVMPKWTQDPTVAWRAENAAVGSSDGAVGTVTFTAKSLAGYTPISREIAEDSDLTDLLTNAYAKAVATAWDFAALKGSGSSNQPLGVIMDSTNVTDRAALATNGQTPTWDNLIDAVAGVRGRSENVSAIIYHPRNAQALAKVKDTTNAYLTPPAYLDGVPRLETATLPVNETTGTSSLTNSMVTGNFSYLALGVRTEFGINVYEQPLATSNAQYVIMAWFRGDVQVLRGSAFAVRTGLLA